jgi:hypothetical protein
VMLAVLSRLLPRIRWSTFFVTPATLLRCPRQLSPEVGPISAASRFGRVSPPKSGTGGRQRRDPKLCGYLVASARCTVRATRRWALNDDTGDGE